MMRHLVLGLFAFLLTACASVSSDYRFSDEKRVGLATGSITFESGIGQYVLVAQGAADGKRFRFRVGDSVWSPFSRWFDPDLDSHGGTYAVELPVGRYELIRWEVLQGSRRSVSTQPIGVTFYVEQGKAAYLGNLHFDQHWLVTLRDREARDLPVIRKRIPALDNTPMEAVLSRGAEIKGIGGPYLSGMW